MAESVLSSFLDYKVLFKSNRKTGHIFFRMSFSIQRPRSHIHKVTVFVIIQYKVTFLRNSSNSIV